MRALVLILVLLPAAGCGDDTPVSPTTPTTVTRQTQTFTSSLSVGGSRFYSISISQLGSVAITLASVSSPTTGHALAIPLELAFGVPEGTGCAATSVTLAAPALTPQLQLESQSGTFCVRVADAGHMTGPVNFAVRFSYP